MVMTDSHNQQMALLQEAEHNDVQSVVLLGHYVDLLDSTTAETLARFKISRQLHRRNRNESTMAIP